MSRGVACGAGHSLYWIALLVFLVVVPVSLWFCLCKAFKHVTKPFSPDIFFIIMCHHNFMYHYY